MIRLIISLRSMLKRSCQSLFPVSSKPRVAAKERGSVYNKEDSRKRLHTLILYTKKLVKIMIPKLMQLITVANLQGITDIPSEKLLN